MATAITTEELGDVRMMSLEQIERELTRLDERRRLLIRVRKFLVELNTDPAENGRRRMRGD